MKNRIYCAVDTSDLAAAVRLAKTVGPHVGGVKAGLEFFNANGREGVQSLMAADEGSGMFLDLKLHDIPNTVAGAVRALGGLRYDVLTVHAAGGAEMMRAARDAARSEARVVGVTLLTSLDENDLAAMGMGGGAIEQVERLAETARSAGLDGIVCSPREVAAMRAAWPEGYFVVPGIRPAHSTLDDQKRTMTPAEALAAGADILVVGRPITAAGDPATAARDIAASLA